MDVATLVALTGLALTGGTGLVAVTVYAATTRDLAEQASHKARNVEQAHAGLVAHADQVYARKDAIEPQLRTINDSLKRIEHRQDDLFDKLSGLP
jgi:hypothetical protein